jgi:two-component system response regulator AtoC
LARDGFAATLALMSRTDVSRIDESTVRDAMHVAPGATDMLVVIHDGELRTFELGAGELVIGRAEGCDIAIDDRSLSRRHAVLRPGPPATVQDLESLNGTRVAGRLHHGGAAIALDAGGTFFIGQITFIVVRREAKATWPASGGDLLRVNDPSPEGVGPFVRDLARSGVNVLILGETGVGKELLASTIHELSERPGALTRINCAALSESLLENELFGHDKGAFTGAAAQDTGLIEAADRGTVFLDEIGELSPGIQAKLLRVVEQREVMRLGVTRPIPLDVRFVAATNRDLVAEVDAGGFRRDLFYRLDGVQLVIPPLRERRGMIGPLALRFLEDAKARAGKPELRFDHEAVAALEDHRWPGNVRELKAVIARAVLLAREQIGLKHLAFAGRSVGERLVSSSAVVVAAPMSDHFSEAQRAERDRIVRALEDCVGNQTRAAKQLGISRSTLVTKLTLYRIPRPRD